MKTSAVQRTTALLIMAFALSIFSQQEATVAFSQATLDTDSTTEINRLKTLLNVNEFDQVIEEATLLIEVIEQEEGYYAEDLYNPLVILGDAEFNQGNYPSALKNWSRARQVSRQAYGLHSLEQTEILYKEADALYAQKLFADANSKHEQAFSMYLRAYGTDAVEILPGLDRLAGWYLNTFNVYAARGLYNDMLTIAKANLDETDPQIIGGLKNLAKTYRMERFRPDFLPSVSTAFKALPYGATINSGTYFPDINNYAFGEQALKEVLKLQLQSPGTTIEEFTESKLDLADWYLLFEKYQRANVVYADVWTTLHGTSAEQLLMDELGEPKQLYFPLPNDPVPDVFTPDTIVMSGEIELSYSVIPEGKTRRVKVLHSDPGDVIDIAVINALRKARFRPAFKDGVAIKTDGLTYSHTFNFTQDALDN